MYRTYFETDIDAPPAAQRSKHSTPETIIKTLRDLPCQVADSSEMWGAERDAAFWAQIGGMKGLLRLQRKAIRLRDVVISFDLSPDDSDELRFIGHRCQFISGLLVFQMALLLTPFPHFPARWAAELYSEIRGRTLTLCRAYRPDLCADLRVHA